MFYLQALLLHATAKTSNGAFGVPLPAPNAAAKALEKRRCAYLCNRSSI